MKNKNKVRVDGHACNGCYNCKQSDNGKTNYCKASRSEIVKEFYVEISYRKIPDVNIKPYWCPYND